MLRRAYSDLDPIRVEHKRFEIPAPRTYVVGARTVFHNFKEVCDVLNRDLLDVLKFVSKEMATSGAIDGTRAIFQGRFYKDAFVKLIRRYVDDFLMCPVCKRPDTKIVREKRLSFLICEACGAKSSIRSV